MDSLEYQVQSLNLKMDRVMSLLDRHTTPNPIVITQSPTEVSQWMDLREAQEMKGGFTLNTLRTRPWLQPCGGTNYTMTAHKKLWPRLEVERWAKLKAEDLCDYCASFGVEVPATYKRLAEAKKRREALLV